jgi:hypothetical protein
MKQTTPFNSWTFLYIDTTTTSKLGFIEKPTETGTIIHLNSNHPHEQKILAFTYYINSLLTLTVTKETKDNEWRTVIAIAKQNGYPASKIHNIKTRVKNKKQNQKQQHEKTSANKKWVTFTYFSPLIRHITGLLKHTNLKVAFRATNTIQQQLTKKQNCKDPSGIYKLKCNTCNKAYVGQSERAITIRYKEHIRYIQTNNPKSAYATHILDNRHEYGTSQDTLQLMHACQNIRTA